MYSFYCIEDLTLLFNLPRLCSISVKKKTGMNMEYHLNDTDWEK